jgi:hypothetical protein
MRLEIMNANRNRQHLTEATDHKEGYQGVTDRLDKLREGAIQSQEYGPLDKATHTTILP